MGVGRMRSLPFRNAAALDQGRADAQFQTARCLDTLGHKEEARAWYFRARDLDRLRFRTAATSMKRSGGKPTQRPCSSLIWKRRSVRGHPHKFPAEHSFSNTFIPIFGEASSSQRSTPASWHYHGILAPSPDWARRDTIGDESLWARRGATALDERIADRRIQILTSGMAVPRPESDCAGRRRHRHSRSDRRAGDAGTVDVGACA